MKRRDFLMMGAVAAASMTAVRRGSSASARRRQALAHRDHDVRPQQHRENQHAARLRSGPSSSWTFGQFCADRFKVHNIELQSNYFPSTEMSWLKDFKSRLDKTNTKVVQINLEFGAGYNMGADSPSGRLQMIDLHRSWFDKAAFLGCPRVLLNQGQPTQENKAQIIANYQAVVALAKAKGITAASENRNAGGGRGRAAGPAAPGQPAQPPPPTPEAPAAPSYIILTEILKASGTASCVDFLNFPNQEEQLAGIRDMLPINSGLVHAGMRHDLPPAMKICREQGYKGLYSIKASGLPGDPAREHPEDH